MNAERDFLWAPMGRFLRDDRGGTAIEYGLIAGLLSIAIAGVAMSVGTALVENYYEKVLAALTDAVGEGGGEGD